MDFSNKENAPARHYHSTYTNKPMPTLQMISQNSQLNEEGRSINAYQNPGAVETAPVVPTTWDALYDPSHPDADWSGLVSRNHVQKRHNHNHISHQEGIERTEFGIVSKETRQDWSRKRTPQDAAISKNAGTLVIGGIDAQDDRWKTTYSRFDHHEPTGRDQLTLEKRVNPVKRISDPAQAKSSQYSSGNPTPRDQYDNIGNQFQAQQQHQSQRIPTISAKTNFLSGLGEKIVSNPGGIAIKDPQQSPRQPRPAENYRVLMGDNYKPFPGKKYIFLQI
jgi:hypothetical protein